MTRAIQDHRVTSSYKRRLRRWCRKLCAGGFLLLVATEPALAQTVGENFCGTDMATTIQNIFAVIQFGGPLIGGTLAVGAIVLTPTVRRSDVKKELKEIRNQGLLWGVIVAPLATAIIQFILNSVVAGGTSCGF
jgi:hypothetical protein